MNWDFLDIFNILMDAVNLLGNTSNSSEISYNQKQSLKKKTKYLTEKISIILLLFSIILLFFVFKNPLSAENYVQTLIVGSLIGFVLALVSFFILYSLEKYYFKNVLQWIFFSCSVILFYISLVFCVYFKSGIFI